MTGRVSRGWQLLGQSWSVLRQDRELLVFPVLSSLACLLVLASFAIPLGYLSGSSIDYFNEPLQPEEEPIWRSVGAYVALFVYYFVNYGIIAFFNTALVSCAIIRFRGGDPTVRDGLSAAGHRLPQILGWALLAATVGVFLRAIEERSAIVGRIVAGLIGIAWSIATYLVVPVLAAEGVGPLTAVRRASQLLRKTWGESLVAELSLGAINLLLALPAIIIIAVSIAMIGAGVGIWLPATLGVIAVLYLVLLAVVTSALGQVFLAGVYLYAAESKVAAGFSEESVAGAFHTRN
jgi:hypothetical protein